MSEQTLGVLLLAALVPVTAWLGVLYLREVDRNGRAAEAADKAATPDDRTAVYIDRAADAVENDDEAVRPWLTRFCTECGMAADEADPRVHVLAGEGLVLIGCEGYWLINPEALGLERGQWQDWRDDELVVALTLDCDLCGAQPGEPCKPRCGYAPDVLVPPEARMD